MSAARGGDLRAWEWIVRRNQELVFRNAYLLTRDSVLAEATTRAVATRAYRSLVSLAGGAELRPWLLRLTDTAARGRMRETAHRRDARAPEPEPSPRIPASPIAVGPGLPRLDASERATLIEAFDRLPDDDRILIAARYAFGLGRDAAAARLGITSDAVDQRLAAALSRLRGRASQVASSAPVGGDASSLLASARGRLSAVADDELGILATAAVFSELPWTPDVARISCEQLAREAVAYPATPVVVADPDGRASARERTVHRGAAVTPRPARRRGPSGLRSLGLLAGASLVGVSLMLSSGSALGLGWDVPPEVRSEIAAFLGSPEASPGTTTSTRAQTSDRSRDDRAEGVASTPATQPATDPPTPVVSVVGVRRLDGGGLKAVVRIETDGFHAAGAMARVERKVADDSWVAGEWADAGQPLLAVIRPDRDYRFRVRALDAGGDETISNVSRVRLSVRGAQSDRLVHSKGDWRMRPGPAGGKRLVATAPGARLRTTFRGSHVALVGRDVPAVQEFSVRVDGGPWDHEPAAGERLGRWVLFSEDLAGGQHQLDLLAPADGLGIDALLILRSLQA